MRFPRASGVLLHPTSLPGPHGSGDCGPAAYHFVDWLVSAGQSLWQILPLNGIGAGNSPYASNSAFAGNVLLVDLQELQQQGWLSRGRGRAHAWAAGAARRLCRGGALPHAAPGAGGAALLRTAAVAASSRTLLPAPCRLAGRLCAVHGAQRGPRLTRHGATGPRRWCGANPAALAQAAQQHAERIAFWKFGQWCFFRQWLKLKAYAHQRGVQIIGDVPIFIGHHSAEVWSHQALFELGADGQPTVVAGVPPDFFSATGQRWGNPLYRWDVHARDGYAWWVERMRCVFELVDIVRIDHFRGFAGYWEIPASEPTAIHGQWRPGPGADLFKAIHAALGPMPIIAEDLGVITPDVEALRRRFQFPGMRILQFAFGDDASNSFLPHHHECDTVVYPGTHDNDTSVGWWAGASEAERHFARAYLDTDGHDMAWALIRSACASVADTAVYAMQDVLSLPGECRMNFPGQSEGWWEWRMQWSQVQDWHAQRLAELCRLYDRLPRSERK